MKVVTKNGLPLGLGIRVQASVRGEQHRVSIRGWMDNQYIIADIPNFHGEVIRLAPQTGVTINYTIDGTFVSFKTAVLHTFYQAVSLMVLEFPRDFDTYNLRRHQRQKAHFPMAFSLEKDADTPSQGAIRDISIKGALIVHSDILRKGDRVFLSFQLQTGMLNNLPAEVRNIRVNRKNGSEQFVTGLQFVKVPEDQTKALRQFVESRLNDRRNLKRN